MSNAANSDPWCQTTFGRRQSALLLIGLGIVVLIGIGSSSNSGSYPDSAVASSKKQHNNTIRQQVYPPNTTRISSTAKGAVGAATTATQSATAEAATRTTQQTTSQQVQASLQFLQARKQAYQAAGLAQNWHLRGIAHLYEHRNVLLVGQHLIENQNVSSSASHLNERHYIRIDNVYEQAASSPSSPTPACERLTMWVRVRGPEIFAGKAHAVDEEGGNGGGGSCHWRFDFEARVAGSYKMEAKVLLWNAFNRSQTKTCAEKNGPVPPEIVQQYPQHAGFKGFKLYNSGPSCCAICTRQVDPPCRYWATPAEKMAIHKNWSTPHNGCELYFDANVTKLPFASVLLGDLTNVTWPHEQKQRRLGLPPQKHGRPLSRDNAENTPMYFVGCGWHQMFTLDFPCLSAELDDKVYLTKERFSITRQEEASALSDETLARRPLCTLKHEYSGPSQNRSLAGRWVKEPWPNASQCPLPFEQLPRKPGVRSSDITVNDGDHPHCWNRDDLSKTGNICIEMNCRFIHDWSKYKSDFRERRWMGHWKRYDCSYYEYTDAELQQCIQKLQISKFARDGVSVAKMVGEYVDERIKPLQLYNGTSATTGRRQTGRTVTLGTLSILHKTLMNDTDFVAYLRSKPRHTTRENLYFLMSPFFTTSEREVNTHMERMAQFDDWFKESGVLGIVLQEEGDGEKPDLRKGYRYLNAFDMSAAMSYEASGQLDGMHMIGPTAKMIVTKLFHHLCRNVVEGSHRI